MFMQVGISSCLPRHFTRGGVILAVDPGFGCEVMTTPPSDPDKVYGIIFRQNIRHGSVVRIEARLIQKKNNRV